MLRFILGRAGSGKTGLILGEIAERAARREDGNYLIVPEQYSHEAERELARRCGDTMSLYAEVLSFSRLAHYVSLEVGGSARRFADAGGRILQMSLALETAEGGLAVYGGAARNPETAEMLLKTLDELRQGKADSALLREAAAHSEGMLAQKLSDLALLREALDAVEERSGLGSVSRLDILAEQIPACTFLRGAHVYIDGFTDFTAQERAVIRELTLTGECTACLTCDGLDGGDNVFRLSREAGQSLRRLAEEDGVSIEVKTLPGRGEEDPIGFLEAHLFDWSEASADPCGRVRLLTAPTPAAECELAAGSIRRIVRETGCRWRDVAVAVRGFDDLRGTLEETFRRYEVPFYSSVKTDILSKPLPTLVNAAFELLEDGWSYESMFTYLKTGLPEITLEERDELENYVLLWGLRGTAWTREEPWRQNPRGVVKEWTDEDYAALARLNALRRRIAAPLQRFAERGRAAVTAAEQCRGLADLWDDISLPERLEQRAGELEAAGEAQTAAEYRQLWEKMAASLEQCAAVLGSMEMDQSTFARLFRRVLCQYDTGSIPVTLDRVGMGDFDRMRRRSLKHLFVLGATDDRLPRVSDESGILNDPEREELRRLGIELANPDDILQREFTLIYNVFTLPEATLTVSRPLFGTDGKETRPALPAERLGRLFGLKEAPGDLTAARREALSPARELACAGDPPARAYFASLPGEPERMERLRAACTQIRGQLSRPAAERLYGRELRLTASRAETAAECRFRFFLRYGLKAEPRKTEAFAPPEMGTFLHYLLENVVREASARGGFDAVTDEEIEALTEEWTARFTEEQLSGFREKTARFRYLFRRLADAAKKIVLDSVRELRGSQFRPLALELDLGRTEGLPPALFGEGDEQVILTGIVDRVDGWEHDGRLFLRVVDYKSGTKDFKLGDVSVGLSLQMLLYLFALQKVGVEYFGKGEIVPAGVLYVPAREPLVNADKRVTPEEAEKRKEKELKRSGLLLRGTGDEVLRAMEAEPGRQYLPVKISKVGGVTGSIADDGQFRKLGQFVEKTLGEMAAEIRRGSIAADPWFKGENDNACRYCDYAEACHFNEETDKRRYRAGMDTKAFWDMLEKKTAAAGKGEDAHGNDE